MSEDQGKMFMGLPIVLVDTFPPLPPPRVGRRPPDSTVAFCIELERRIDNVELLMADPRYGPGHIVFDDYNLEDHNVKWCIELIDSMISGATRMDTDQASIAAHRELLEWVLTVPENVRCPEGYGCLCTVKDHGVDH